MNNLKTGCLIRELRKEKGLTQKELADKLHITDRAVSKWERGLCAPDISLLEPLSQVLDITVLELISGEHIAAENRTENIDTSIKKVILYSENDIAQKTKSIKQKIIVRVVAVITLFLLTVLLISAINSTLTGDGFALQCIPAYITAQKASNAIEACDKLNIEESIGNAENVYNGLIKLQEQGVVIRDASVNFYSVKLEDMLLMFKMDFIVEYQNVKYIFTCNGTYRNGKVELMHIIHPNVGEKYPDWFLQLSDALATYDAG